MTQTHCLNLHERYTPEWGVWECARELYSNAKDACPDEMIVRSPDANTLEIHTSTVPDLSELFIIGCGSKSVADENIGQFGEGLKLTALVASRTSNSSLILDAPNQRITFQLRDHLGQKVLFADVEESDFNDGFLCTLKMKGAGYALNGKIIEGDDSHSIPKPSEAEVQIFCKGVWIMNLPVQDAMYSYNLNDIPLNRDRSHANVTTVQSQIGRLLLDTLDEPSAIKLFNRTGSWEDKECLTRAYFHCSTEAHMLLAKTFTALYGDKAVLLTDVLNHERIAGYGYKPVSVGEGLTMLLSGYVTTDEQILAQSHALEEVPFDGKWASVFAELNLFASLLEMPFVEFKVFRDDRGELYGKADGHTVWLNERYMRDDLRFERIRTVFHELAHIQSGATDGTTSFEAGLDLLGAKLALEVLQ